MIGSHFFCFLFFPVVSGCGGTWSGTTGTITSPGYPSVYSNGPDCVFTIQPPANGQKIQMRFEFCQISYSDRLEVLNSTGDRVANLVGHRGYHTALASTSYTATFYRNSPYVHYGFVAKWAPCGGTWTADTGSITSPLHPGNYYKRAHCRYDVLPTSGNNILLTIDAFNIQDGDFVTLHNHQSTLMANLSGTVGNHAIGPSTSFTLEFTSDSQSTASGFKMSWTVDAAPIKPIDVHSSCTAAGSYQKVSDGSIIGFYLHIRNLSSLLDCLYLCAISSSCTHFTFVQSVCALIRTVSHGLTVESPFYEKL